MFELTMLPAGHGDCLWLTYGDAGTARHMIVDGGPEHMACLRHALETRLAAQPGGRLHIELLVVSHIDDDHIGGIVELLENPPAGVSFGDIWFNAQRHLLPPDRLGVPQAERLSTVLLDRQLPWNKAFDGKAVVIPDVGPLPRISLEGGLVLTLLSPDRERLSRLAPVWQREVRRHGLEAGLPVPEPVEDRLGRDDPWPPDIRGLATRRPQFDNDRANGASIALLAAYDGRNVVLSADVFSSDLEHSLDRLEPADGRLTLAALQVPHHGSRKNLTNAVLDRIRCQRYLLSTNGAYSGHPDPEAIARILMRGGDKPELIFNYRSRFTARWAESALLDAPPFTPRFPPRDQDGILVKL